MEISFKNLPAGPYTEDMLKKQWPGVTNIKGIAEGRCEIVDVDGENALQVTFIKEKLGPTDGGASWRYRFEKPFDEFTVEYKVMKLVPNFPDGFHPEASQLQEFIFG